VKFSLLNKFGFLQYNIPLWNTHFEEACNSFLWQVDKKTIKTRAFQEACICSVVDLLAKHLAKWSYSIDFFEMPLFYLFGPQAIVKPLTLIDLGKR
jgi:hypothetical protein